jgi:hypothetical protein
LALAAAFSATVVGVASPQVASACSLQVGSNWGVAEWDNTLNEQQGGSINTTVSPVGVSGASGGSHVNQTIWVATNESTNLDPNTSEWVELGYIKSLDCTTNLEFYWADERDSCFFGRCFNTHLVTAFTPVVGNTYRLWIVNVGPSTWNVNINGTNVGQSTSNNAGSHSMETGVETSTTSNYLPSGDSDNMSNKVNGSWTSNWGSGTQVFSTDPPCTHAAWVTGQSLTHLTDGIYGCG